MAAVSSIATVRDQLLQLNDRDIDATLAQVSTTHGPSGSTVELPARVGASTSAGGRFRILRPHAQGGLGMVSVALDCELNREVALKELLPFQSNDSGSRARFNLEAEVTGGLEHPGVVPVYGLGQYADGRPFYAMRLIRGHSLKAAIARFHARDRASSGRSTEQSDHFGEGVDSAGSEQTLSHSGHQVDQGKSPVKGGLRKTKKSKTRWRNPAERTMELRKLLRRIIDVCNAIEYAHSRGVLHRDLKPGNIMLGKYGETLVVDWGLAKAIGRPEDSAGLRDEVTLRPGSGSSVAATQIGLAIGTPAYMSPEQAAGKLTELGPASDVYCLGTTLYSVLTGRRPVNNEDVDTALRRIQLGDIPRPRQVSPQVPPALEAICLRAMALEPENRYASPRDMADDLEKWLADEPVLAFQEPIGARVRRMMRKHQTLATTTAAVLLVSAIGLAIFATIVSGKNTQLTTANQREHNARMMAEANEQSARQQSQLALATLATVIGDIQGGLSKLAGGGEIRRRLLQTSLDKLESVATQYVNQASVDLSTSHALVEMGELILQFGSGDTGSSTTATWTSGQQSPEQQSAVKLAETFFRRAHEIANRLAALDPDDRPARRELSRTYKKIGWLHLMTGEVTEAMAHFQESLDISQRLATDDPDNIVLQHDLAESYNRKGDILRRYGNMEEALDAFQNGLGINQRLASDLDNVKAQRDLTISYDRVGDVQRKLGHIDEALDAYTHSLEIRLRLAEAEPENMQAQDDLTLSYGRLGNIYFQNGMVTEALENYQKSLDISQRLAEADPNDDTAQRSLAISSSKLGDVQMQSGLVNEAFDSYERSLIVNRRLADADPTNLQAQRDLSVSLIKYGDVQLQSGLMDEAMESFQQGVEIRRQLRRAIPTTRGRSAI